MRTLKHVYIILLSVLIFAFITACGEDDPVAPEEHHFEAEGVVLYLDGTKDAEIFRGETTDTLFVNEGETTGLYTVRFYDEDKNEIDPPDEEEMNLGFETGNSALVNVNLSGENSGYAFTITGLQKGTTYIELEIIHGDHDEDEHSHADLHSGEIPVTVR